MASSEELDLRVEIVDKPDYFFGVNDDGENSLQSVISNAFGKQIRDAIWRGLNPGWDTHQGAKASADRLKRRWESTTLDKDNNPNTIFLAATVCHKQEDYNQHESAMKRQIVGLAIWAQLSQVPGYGEPVFGDLHNADGKGHDALAELYPNDPDEQTYHGQAFSSLVRRRVEIVNEKAAAFDSSSLAAGEKPATFHLDLCVVDPAWQRRGIAQKLVGWGVEEARRRSGLECSTEASSMGRGAYMKLGFKPDGEGRDIVYDVDEKFKNQGRDPLPPNLFLRTGLLS